MTNPGIRVLLADDEEADRKLAELCWSCFDERYPKGHRVRSEAMLDSVVREL